MLNAANGFASLIGNVVVALDDIIANHPEVDLVNMSLGTFSLFTGNCDASAAFNIITATAIDTLRATGVTTFASSGNQASGTQMSSPACIANTIAVGATYDANIGSFTFSGVCTDATTAVDQVACFTNSNSTTDIFAPGCSATSTGLANGTSAFCGTSQVSPTSAGCAALLLDQDATLTPAQIEARLQTSDVSVTDATNGLSFPRIDCFGPVGGIAELADVDPPALEDSGPGPSPGVVAAVAGAGALLVAAVGAAWFARRRWLR